VALALYAVLAVLAWFTMGADKVLVNGNWVDLRLLPLFVLGVLAVRTVLAAKADRIRRSSKEE
jgi:nicotinic acid phosphoribosyltransferase